MPGGDRAARMARSVARALHASRLPGASQESARAALALAMAPRVARLHDEHHAAYLHPGRSQLVLLRDAADVVTGPALVCAAVLESEDAELEAPAAGVESALGRAAVEAREAVPRPGSEAMLEALVGLPSEVALAALTERLDHLRHLHMREDLRGVWAERHREAVEVWLPFSARTHPRLAARFAHWERAFRRRL